MSNRAALVMIALVGACGTSGPRTDPPPPVTSNTAEPAPPADRDAPAADAPCADPAACLAEGEALRAPVATATDPAAAADANARALARFEAACDGGLARGCEAAAEVLQDHRYYGVAADGPRAARLWDRACELGWAHACFRYGFYLWEGLMEAVVLDGEVVPYRWNDHRALGLPLVKRGCDGGVARACELLAELRAAGQAP